MNAFDFDNTIYKGESSFDFFLFLLKKKPSLAKYLPWIIWKAIIYKSGKLPESALWEATDRMGKAMTEVGDLNLLAREFWNQNRHKIKAFYRGMQQPDDVIVSASPRFLLEPICEELGIEHLVCSEFDVKTGKLIFANFREKKIQAFREAFPEAKIEKFYTDSVNDEAFLRIATEGFMVKGNAIVRWEPSI